MGRVVVLLNKPIAFLTFSFSRGAGAYVRGGDARRTFWIKLLKETDLGEAQAFLSPKRDHVKHRQMRKLGFYEWSK